MTGIEKAGFAHGLGTYAAKNLLPAGKLNGDYTLYWSVYMSDGVSSLMTLPSERRSERMERW